MRIIYSLLVLLFFLSCKTEPTQETNSKQNKVTSKGINISTEIIQAKTFNTQLISNGVIENKAKADLRFKTAERIAKIYVKNGQKVKKGTVLAKLDNALLANQIQQEKVALRNAEVNLTREKIIFEIHKKEERDVKPNILKTVYSKSGYNEAKARLKNAQIRYNQTILKAPFSGTISNLTTKAGNYISNSDVFCTLFSQSKNQTEVVFSILEQELSFVDINQPIILTTFSNKEKEFTGKIIEINPSVDENGLISIKASLDKPEGSLLNGMHVKIVINKPIKNVVVIPKKALVLRSNKEVVFTVKNGLAKWNYVEVLHENSTSYAIKKGLKIGDTIIVSGNLNLAHDAVVNY